MADDSSGRITFENRLASAPKKDDFGRVRAVRRQKNPSEDQVRAENQLYHSMLTKGYRPPTEWEEAHKWGVFHISVLDDQAHISEVSQEAALRIEYAPVDMSRNSSSWIGEMLGEWIALRGIVDTVPVKGVLFLTEIRLQDYDIEMLSGFKWCRWMTIEEFLTFTREQVLGLFADVLKPTSSTIAPSVLTAAASIPASDRIVRINDNDPSASVLIDSAVEVANELATSNSLPVEAEERLVLLREVQGLLGQLQSKVVRLGALQAAMSKDGILGYLKGRFPDHVMSGLVGALIGAIGTWIASLF